MTDKQRNILIGVLVLFILVFVFIKGGDTVLIANQTPKDICEVNFAFSPDQEGWGKNWLSSYIRHGHARDIRLPVYWGWFSGIEDVYQGRLVDCDGDILDQVEGLGLEDNFFLWEVR